MKLKNIIYRGPQLDDQETFDRLPEDYQALLAQMNGFIKFGGGLHVRGACLEPTWHSLREVWTGEHALHRSFTQLQIDDVPFGQDALGDQYLLRNEVVHHLRAETGALDSLHCGLFDFLAAAEANPVEYLALAPLLKFQEQGQQLEPGQLLSAYPPFCTKESAQGVHLAAIPMMERIAFLARFAAQIADVP
jgi:hypothetical protein